MQRPGLVEHVEVRLAADHRGDGEHLERRLAEPREPAAGDLAHAVGHARVQRDAPPRAARVREVAQDLLDEERVALGLLVQLVDERGRRPAAVERGHERGRLAGVEAGQLDPLERPLAAQAREQRRERLARPRRRAPVARNSAALRRRRAHEVAEQLERRQVGPVQVVEHDEQRRVAGDLRQQRGDPVEQAQPLGAGLGAVQRRPAPAAGAPSSGRTTRSSAARGPSRSANGASEAPPAQPRSICTTGW